VEQAGPALDGPVSLGPLTSHPPAKTLPLLADALRQRFPGRLFARKRDLVEVDDDGRVHGVSVDRLSALLQRAVQVRFETKAGDIRWRPVGKEYARWLRADPSAYFSALRGVRRLPFVTTAGEIARRRGYYPADRIQLDIEQTGDPDVGRDVLREVLGRCTLRSRVALLGLLVEPIVRPAIRDPSPCWFISCTELHLARDAARALARYVAGRPPIDHGLPAKEAGLALHAARTIASEGPLLLLESVPRIWSLSTGDIHRVLSAPGRVDLTRGGGRITVDAGLTTCLAWGRARLPLQTAALVSIALAPLGRGPGAFAPLADHRLDVAAAILEFVERSRSSEARTGSRWEEWERLVGGVLRVAAPGLGLADADDVDQWLADLVAAGSGGFDPWTRLLTRWPVGADGRSTPLSARKVRDLILQLGVHDLIPHTPAGTDHAAVSAVGLLLTKRIEAGDVAAGLVLARRKGRNGQTYYPEPLEEPDAP
jgi:hypothetical protein